MVYNFLFPQLFAKKTLLEKISNTTLGNFPTGFFLVQRNEATKPYPQDPSNGGPIPKKWSVSHHMPNVVLEALGLVTGSGGWWYPPFHTPFEKIIFNRKTPWLLVVGVSPTILGGNLHLCFPKEIWIFLGSLVRMYVSNWISYVAVDGSEIRRENQWRLVVLSHYLQSFIHATGGCLGFLNHQRTIVFGPKFGLVLKGSKTFNNWGHLGWTGWTH